MRKRQVFAQRVTYILFSLVVLNDQNQCSNKIYLLSGNIRIVKFTLLYTYYLGYMYAQLSNQHTLLTCGIVIWVHINICYVSMYEYWYYHENPAVCKKLKLFTQLGSYSNSIPQKLVLSSQFWVCGSYIWKFVI